MDDPAYSVTRNLDEAPSATARPAAALVADGAIRDFTGENLVFIVGAPRSGTTWLQRLLASHPNIVSGQESHLFANVAPLLRNWNKARLVALSSGPTQGRGGVGLPCYFSDDEYRRCVKVYLNSLLQVITAPLQPGEIFLEKTPGHSLYVTEIAELLPRARIIHLIRDPRDVVASLLAASTAWGSSWAPRKAGAAAGHWLKHVRRARESGRHLPDTSYREVFYETLLASPAPALSSLATFIGVEWDSASIEVAIDANRAEELRRGGGTPLPLRGEIGKRRGVVVEPESFVRKARAGGWKEDLSFVQKLQVWRVVGDAMQEFGYRWTPSDWR